MSEQSFEQMLEESLVTIHNNQVVEGKVISVKEDEIVLNIGYKADGIITRNEYSNTPNIDLRTVVKEGDTMEAKVLKVNDGEGQVLLTYKRLMAEKGNKRIEEAYNNQEVLKAPVAAVLDGGLSVVVEEARVFIPASLVSDTYEKNLSKYAGQEIEFVITEFNPKRRRIIGDRKQLLVAKKKELQKELFEKISVGMTVEGTVKNVTDFGAFIDLGGADGLLHISEMSWGRVDSPKKLFKVGDVVKVLIKDIQGEKIALSLKFEDQNPWITAADKYQVGTVVTGKVARMTDFGAFVELEPGIDALLHVSQISREHVEKPSDVLKIGEEVTAKVVDFNGTDKKISLSVKALSDASEDQDAADLRKAMKGLGTDEGTIIKIIANRTQKQRVLIKESFQRQFSRDLIKDLKSELNGKLEDAILNLFKDPIEYDCEQLKKSMKGAGTDEDSLIEIICSRPKPILQKIKEVYKTHIKSDLEANIKSDVKGNLQTILLSLISGERSDNMHPNPDLMKNKAKELYDAGEAKKGNDVDVFIKIFTELSPWEIVAVNKEYINLTGHSLIDGVDKEFKGDIKKSLKSIIYAIVNPSEYFATRVKDAIKGFGTNDNLLMRIIISRDEIDMPQIKEAYLKLYGKDMVKDIKSDIGGEYQKLMVELCDH